jgi:hypothetical protein
MGRFSVPRERPIPAVRTGPVQRTAPLEPGLGLRGGGCALAPGADGKAPVTYYESGAVFYACEK